MPYQSSAFTDRFVPGFEDCILCIELPDGVQGWNICHWTPDLQQTALVKHHDDLCVLDQFIVVKTVIAQPHSAHP